MQNRRNRNRTHYIHRLSYTAQERLAGSFVLIALFVLVWLLVSSEKTQNLFEEEYTLYGTMNSIQAVNEDTNVIVSGLVVGSVTRVDITDDNRVVVAMSILKKYQKLIRTDSTADLLSFKFALVGKSAIEISMGSPGLPVLEDGSRIKINESLNLVKIIEKVEPVLVSLEDSIRQTNLILHAIDPEKVRLALDSAQQTLTRTEQILAKIQPEKIAGSIDNLHAISADASGISQQLHSGRGVAGSMLYD
ncbi:MAG TPA: MCE family protein, partial [Thiotrichales bacterium]|nr:MCE family protein [Thiotrichales bacterium]